ncbi:lasso peptide biosynthesis B2 protein [Actinomadura sp. 21ATH]|uniref:lasso peptide biosynthesis B2 protein n=1 Tax=Actinomadura sp. 21ATH TaxID=1735444 RepID=UPI0035BFA0B5
MSTRVVLEERARVGFGRRIAAWVVVVVARGLVRLSPGRLRRVLEAVRGGARPATVAEAAAARRAVVAVSVLCAGQGCLPRSVATALLCRLGGSWPDWCTGVLTEPFRAHAWVEAEGAPVGEDTGHYHKVMTVPARGGGR